MCEHSRSKPRKLSVGLNVMRNEGLVRIAADGGWQLLDDAIGAAQIEVLVQRSRQKAERDLAMLERMVAYAQSGRCRWNQLLAHLEDEPSTERCGTCDNCLRLERHEAEQARVPQVQPGARAAAAAQPAAPIVVESARFEVGQRVRTRKHGAAEVVAADSVGITVMLRNGERRCFQPQFLQPVNERASSSTTAAA